MSSCQQFALYAAEETVSEGRVFTTIADVQAYVDELRETVLWQRQYANVRFVECYELHESADCSVGFYRAKDRVGQIEMLPRHFTELFVLHELAHVLAEARYKSNAHDPWFARTYLELVYAAVGSAAYTALRQAFVDGGIDFEHDSSVPGGVQL